MPFMASSSRQISEPLRSSSAAANARTLAQKAGVEMPIAQAAYEVLTGNFGNPSSGYEMGRRAAADIKSWRADVAAALGCTPAELFFTSCGTESDNWALRAAVRAMRTGLDMVCPMLVQAGALCMIEEEEVRVGLSVWRVCAHMDSAVAEKEPRSDERIMRMLAELEGTTITDRALEHMLNFVPDGGEKAVHKTSVSMVIRDEKRIAQQEDDEPYARETEIIRMPRFMQERSMTGAQIGTVFHRMARMLDLSRLRETDDLEREIARQMETMREDSVVSEAEYKAVFIPTTSPDILNIGPPDDPWFMDASV